MEPDDLDSQEEGESSDQPGMYYIEKSKHRKRQPVAETGTGGKFRRLARVLPNIQWK